MSGDDSRNFGKATSQSHDIATKAEMDARVAARPTPKVEHHLTPGGGIEVQVRQSVNLENENRIQDLRSRLDNRSEQFKEHFSRSRMHGKGKADFERSR